MELAQQVCNLLFNTNFGINFILFCATGQNFRRAIRCMFLKRFRRRNVTMTQVSNQGKQNGTYEIDNIKSTLIAIVFIHNINSFIDL